MISGTHNWKIGYGTVTGNTPDNQWLSVDAEAGKLYFTANEEKIDITNLISYDIPFTYTYTDKLGIIHHIVVGGEFSKEQGLKNVGSAEYLRYKAAMDAEPDSTDAGWMGGCITNYLNKHGEAYPWVTKGYEMLGIPLTPPEA